jgi:hypothetical protein
MTASWESTPGALLRQGTLRPRALATVPGPDPRPRASQYPDAAAEHAAAWGTSRWAFDGFDEDTGESKTQFVDNSVIRAEMRRLAEQGWQGAWLSFPDLGRPPRELAPLFAAAAARNARAGTEGPHGRDEAMQAMIDEADYQRTQWAKPPGRWD